MKSAMNFVLVLIQLACFSSVNCKVVNQNLVDSVCEIIDNVYSKLFTTTNVIIAANTSNDRHPLDFEEVLLKKCNQKVIFRLDTFKNIQRIAFRKKIYNVILVDEIENAEILIGNIKPISFNYFGFYLFVLLNNKTVKGQQKIFDAMLRKGIINVNTLFEEEEESVSMTTFFPFGRNTKCSIKNVDLRDEIDGNCSSTVPYKINSFEFGSFKYKSDCYFPDKTRNLNGCPVRVATFLRCPAVCPGKSNKKTGFDMSLLMGLSRSLKFTVHENFLQGDEQWGKVYENGTTTGAISKVANDEVDLTIGNFLLRPSRTKYMNNSVPYFSYPIVFIIPPGKRLSAYEKLLQPFEYLVWVILASTFLMGISIIFILNFQSKTVKAFVFGRGIESPYTNMLIAIFGGSQRVLPRRNFSRFLLTMFLVLCLVKRNVYQGSLYLFLQSDGRAKEVQSIDQMIDQHYEFYMFESYTDLVVSYPKIYEK